MIDYAVVNRTQDTIYLVNKLHRGEDPPEFDPNLAYVKLRPHHGGIVDITKRAIYPKRQVYNRIYPHPTRVDPGQRFQERVTLQLPLCENVQYQPGYRAEEAQRAIFGGVCFSVQYFRALPGSTEERIKTGDRELLFVESPNGRLHQSEILQSPIVAMQLCVCPRPAPRPEAPAVGCSHHVH